MIYKIVKTKYGFYLKKYTAKYCGTIQDKNRELFHLFEVR